MVVFFRFVTSYAIKRMYARHYFKIVSVAQPPGLVRLMYVILQIYITLLSQ